MIKFQRRDKIKKYEVEIQGHTLQLVLEESTLPPTLRFGTCWIDEKVSRFHVVSYTHLLSP
jgi:hypothetical protein